MQQQAIAERIEAGKDQLLYDRPDAAQILNISLRKLDHLLAAGELAEVRIGTRLLIARSELLAFIERKTSRRLHGTDRAVQVGSA